MSKVHIKKGDNVKILAGDSKGKTGKVLENFEFVNEEGEVDINKYYEEPTEGTVDQAPVAAPAPAPQPVQETTIEATETPQA